MEEEKAPQNVPNSGKKKKKKKKKNTQDGSALPDQSDNVCTDASLPSNSNPLNKQGENSVSGNINLQTNSKNSSVCVSSESNVRDGEGEFKLGEKPEEPKEEVATSLLPDDSVLDFSMLGGGKVLKKEGHTRKEGLTDEEPENKNPVCSFPVGP